MPRNRNECPAGITDRPVILSDGKGNEATVTGKPTRTPQGGRGCAAQEFLNNGQTGPCPCGKVVTRRN